MPEGGGGGEGGVLAVFGSGDSVESPGSRGPDYLEEIDTIVVTPEPRSPKAKDDARAPMPAGEGERGSVLAGCGEVPVLDGAVAANFWGKELRRARRLDYEAFVRGPERSREWEMPGAQEPGAAVGVPESQQPAASPPTAIHARAGAADLGTAIETQQPAASPAPSGRALPSAPTADGD